jgi:hypothetical protein
VQTAPSRVEDADPVGIRRQIGCTASTPEGVGSGAVLCTLPGRRCRRRWSRWAAQLAQFH